MNNTVELLGHYGGDRTHAMSAWTSTSREMPEEKVARIGPLLKMLAENGHHTPFEKSMLHFLVTTDIATHIHIIKHRIGVSVNGESARYKELKDDKYYWPVDWEDLQPTQDRWAAEFDFPHDELLIEYRQHILKSFELYHRAMTELTPTLGRKRAKESARYILPYATQITADVAFNFRSFMEFLRLRNEEHAQDEVHEVANKMLEQVIALGDFDLSLKGFGYAN